MDSKGESFAEANFQHVSDCYIGDAKPEIRYVLMITGQYTYHVAITLAALWRGMGLSWVTPPMPQPTSV